MFNKILIANRGEIACRIIKTVKRLGMVAVAIYSSADEDSLHVSMADEAYWVGEAPALQSYLNQPAILSIAQKHGIDAIHPGYGFLSENTEFARACHNLGIVFIGPSIDAMQAMASKQLSKQMLESTRVPLTPGYHGSDQSDERLLQEARRLGFPVLIKAAAGGGGKGMRSVYQEKDFELELHGARREAKASFADDTMILEKLIENPRHVEIQIMADHHGQVIHLFERDCSIQRRHQKIIEEAPAPDLPNSVRQGLADAAIMVAKTIKYTNAGTVEFLVSGHHFYFMEMNTRLQVEHPVTEMITGLDLVEWQIRIAANEPLPLKQSDIKARGHAIECRIYAEDPHHDFLPSIGTLTFLKEPQQSDVVRLDTGMTIHARVTQFYDPMLAKLIAWGDTRAQAIQRISDALKQYRIGGVKTNITFLQAILSNTSFKAFKVTTSFLQDHSLTLPVPDYKNAVGLVACIDYLQSTQTNDAILSATQGWQMHLSRPWTLRYRHEQDFINVNITSHDNSALTYQVSDHPPVTLRIQLHDDRIEWIDNEQQGRAYFETRSPQQWIIYTEEGPVSVARDIVGIEPKSSLETNLRAPMPATVVAILKNIGDAIKVGDRLMVLEAMKMEHTIHAPYDGLLTDIFFDVGTQVKEGATLVAIEMNQG